MREVEWSPPKGGRGNEECIFRCANAHRIAGGEVGPVFQEDLGAIDLARRGSRMQRSVSDLRGRAAVSRPGSGEASCAPYRDGLVCCLGGPMCGLGRAGASRSG